MRDATIGKTLFALQQCIMWPAKLGVSLCALIFPFPS